MPKMVGPLGVVLATEFPRRIRVARTTCLTDPGSASCRWRLACSLRWRSCVDDAISTVPVPRRHNRCDSSVLKADRRSRATDCWRQIEGDT